MRGKAMIGGIGSETVDVAAIWAIVATGVFPKLRHAATRRHHLRLRRQLPTKAGPPIVGKDDGAAIATTRVMDLWR